MTKVLTTDKANQAFYQRQRVWKHNGFRGSARMMQMQLNAIINSDSTDFGTKDIAREMMYLVEHLQDALKTRIDP